MELDSVDFEIPGLAAISVEPDLSSLLDQESSDIAVPLEQSCQLLVHNLYSMSPSSAKRHLKDLIHTMQANNVSLIKVTIVPLTTRGKNINFAFIQPDRPSAHAALGLSKYIPMLTKMGHETVWSPASGQDPMRTVSIKHEGSDALSGWDSLIVDAIKRQDHEVIMHSFF